MQTITLEEAQNHLLEIIENLAPGQEVTLTRAKTPVAILRAPFPEHKRPPRFGTLRGSILHVAADFDAIPEGFEEYLQ